MTADEFETILEQHLHREPFVPFAVHLTDGQQIVVKTLPVVHGDGSAGFIDLEQQALVSFSHENVSRFEALKQERIIEPDFAIGPRPDTFVKLDPDVSEFFPDAESVNDALRALVNIAQRHRKTDTN